MQVNRINQVAIEDGAGTSAQKVNQEEDTSIFDFEGASDETTIKDKIDESTMNSITNQVSEYLDNNPEETEKLLSDLSDFIIGGGLAVYMNDHKEEIEKMGDNLQNLLLNGGLAGYLASNPAEGKKLLENVKEFVSNGGLIEYLYDNQDKIEALGDDLHIKDIILGGGLVGYLATNQDKAAELLENVNGVAKNFSEKSGIFGWLASPILKLIDMFSNK